MRWLSGSFNRLPLAEPLPYRGVVLGMSVSTCGKSESMSQFKKFPSVAQQWLPLSFADEAFQTARFAVTEKIDGANIQLWFQPGQPYQVGKRNSFVSRDEVFFNLWEVVEQHRDFFDRVLAGCNAAGKSLRLYGELYGSEVVRRIDYRTPGALCFFQIEENGVRLPYAALEQQFTQWGQTHLLAPELGVMTFDEAMKLPLEFASHLNPDATAEGFVICGYDKVFTTRGGMPFLCKMKNPEFLDVEGGDGANPVYFPVTRYINRNRLISVESKHGAFDDLKCMGRYIDQVIAEVDEDYTKDHGQPPTPAAARFKKYIAALLAAYVKERTGA